MSIASVGMTMNSLLMVGAVLSAIAAFLHIAIVVFGAPWYRFFGAGEKMATLAEQGSWVPALITLAIASLLFISSAYALSGAGFLRTQPLLKPALVVITSVYLLRGIAGFWLVVYPSTEHTIAFVFWSSLICLGFGLVHLVGLKQIWSSL